MSYKTSPAVRTSQAVRRGGDKMVYLKTHADADFSLKNVLTCQAVTAASALIPGYCVDSTYFSAARFTTQAAAETAFRDNFLGISSLEFEAGEEDERMGIFTECEVEYDLGTPAVIRNGDYLTWAWDATNGWIMPKAFELGVVGTSIARANDDMGDANVLYATGVVNTDFYTQS